MKKTIITSFIALLAFTLPIYAQTDSAPVSKVDTAPETKIAKTDTLPVKKQKIEADLRITISKLGSVIEKTQTIIDLLNKNNRETTLAAGFLLNAKTSLSTAVEALDQFAGVVLPEAKVDPKILKTDEKIVAVPTKIAPASLKDPLKRAEDSLRDSKASLISSISALKESINNKEVSQ